MSEFYDLAVIGAGPAGTSAAISAARLGHRVLLLERGSFPRQKVCGEFVSSEALELLRGLLAPEHVWHNPPPVVSRARIFVGDRVRETQITPPARSIPRYDMDAALWKAAQLEGATAVEKTLVKEISGDGPFRISTDVGTFISRALIDASGRWSNLAGTSRAPVLEASLGIKQHFHEDEPAASVDLYFFPGGYCGVQPIGGSAINVSAMVLPRFAKDPSAAFQLDPNLQARSLRWRPLSESVSTYPLVHRKPQPVQLKRNILSVGDAAGFIDPFVGDGISMALHSGQMAADCLSTYLCSESSLFEAALEYQTEYEHRLMPAFRNAARLRRLLNAPILRNVALELFRIPAISGLALRSTRARSA